VSAQAASRVARDSPDTSLYASYRARLAACKRVAAEADTLSSPNREMPVAVRLSAHESMCARVERAHPGGHVIARPPRRWT
jgi:hypothetical protein